MMAQVFGTLFQSLLISADTVLAATGRTDDNPVVIDGEVLTSGGLAAARRDGVHGDAAGSR